MSTHKVRTTIQPGVVLEVDDTEYADLKNQGLLVDDKPEQPQESPPRVEKKVS